MLDLHIANARLVDLDSGAETVRDIHVAEGRIVALADSGAAARRVIDAAGALVIPGLVDTHIHLTPELSGRFGFRMLTRAGVTTALDMAGPVAELKDYVPRFGIGLTLYSLESFRPGVNIPDADPDRDTLVRFAKDAMAQGCFGIKLLGGHYPLTPKASRMAIEVAAELGIHVAMHSGTTETRSDIVGMRESIELAGDNFLHLAHINSYCRGRHRDPVHEAQEAIQMLDGRANLVTESYLSPYNAARSALDGKGGFASNIISNSLAILGYEPTVDGLKAAFLDNKAQMNVARGADMALVSGPEGWAEWQTLADKPRICFPVNHFPAQAMIAIARQADGRFVVDALATDGGGIPRNDTLEAGLGLVEAGLMTLVDFLRKSCRDGARRILRRDDIGDLVEGARADIVVLDEPKRAPRTVIYGGSVIYDDGTIMPCGRSELNGVPVATPTA